MRSYELIRSKRKTITMEITSGLTVLVRAPQRMSRRDIDRYVQTYSGWIDEHLEVQRQRLLAHPEPDEEDIPALREQARQYLTQRVGYYSALMGLTPTGIKITSARKRFGSCSWKRGLCFSWRLMSYPPEAVDYIVVHELAHIRHMDHSRAFYALIERYMPDWKRRRAMLKR